MITRFYFSDNCYERLLKTGPKQVRSYSQREEKEMGKFKENWASVGYTVDPLSAIFNQFSLMDFSEPLNLKISTCNLSKFDDPDLCNA
jgi:hypothetical protein